LPRPHARAGSRERRATDWPVTIAGVVAFYDHFELSIVLEPICFVGDLLKRDPFIITVAAMALTIMLVFGFHMARRNSNPIDKAGAQMQVQTAPEFTLQSLD